MPNKPVMPVRVVAPPEVPLVLRSMDAYVAKTLTNTPDYSGELCIGLPSRYTH
jgi:hypothetical protein